MPSLPCQDAQPNIQSKQGQPLFRSSLPLAPDSRLAESSPLPHGASALPAMPSAVGCGAVAARKSTVPSLTSQVLEERIGVERALWAKSLQEFEDVSSWAIEEMVTKAVASACEDRLSCLEADARRYRDELLARQCETEAQQAVLVELATGTMDAGTMVGAERSSDSADVLTALREIYNDLEAIRSQHRQTLQLASAQREAQGKLEEDVDSIRSSFNDIVPIVQVLMQNHEIQVQEERPFANAQADGASFGLCADIASVQQQVAEVRSELLALQARKASATDVVVGRALLPVSADASSGEATCLRVSVENHAQALESQLDLNREFRSFLDREADRRIRDLDFRNKVQHLMDMERAARAELQQAAAASVVTCARAVEAERDARLRAVADLSLELRARRRSEAAVDERLRRLEGGAAEGADRGLGPEAPPRSPRGSCEASTAPDGPEGSAPEGLASALDAEVARRCLDVADLRHRLAAEVAGVLRTVEARGEELADALRAEREDRARDMAEIRAGLRDALRGRGAPGEGDDGSHWSSLGFFMS